MARRTPKQLHELEEEKQTRVTIEHEHTAAQQVQQSSRERFKNRRRVAVLGLVSLVVLLVSVILPENMLADYSTIKDFPTFIDRVMRNVNFLFAVLTNAPTGGNYVVVICRYVAAFLMGAVLGTCGAIYQGSFRNPLASPSTLGVVSGCLLGSVVFYLFLYEGWLDVAYSSTATLLDLLEGLNPLEYFWVIYGRAICAILGGFAVVGIALIVAKVMGGAAMTGIVLVVVGQVFTMVADSAVDMVRYYLESTGQNLRATLVQLSEVAPFSTIVTFTDLAFVGVPLVVTLVALFLMRNRMNVLAFTDEEAHAMGVDAGRFRTLVVLLCTAATGIAVGFCGPVGFVGFVAPHVARRIVSPDFRYLLPASLFIGALFLVIAVQVTNQVAIGADQGVNLITTTLGCIVFLIVAFRNRGGAHAWS